MNTYIKAIGLALLMMTAGLAIHAQYNFDPEGARAGYILTSIDTVNIDYASEMTSIAVMSNCSYTVSVADSWLLAFVETNGNISLHADYYYEMTSRTSSIEIAATDGSFSRTIVVVQTGNQSAATVEGVSKVTVSGIVTTHECSDLNYDISYLKDSDIESLYVTDDSTEFPVTITCAFSGYPSIAYMVYTPRQDGSTDGNWEEIEISYRTSSSGDWISIGEYDLEGTSDETTITFTGGLDSVYQVRIVVNSAVNDIVSGAELSFYWSDVETCEALSTYFADDIYSELREGVTEDALDTIENEFTRQLVYQFLVGEYETDYRVASYECYLPASTHASAIGINKYYDQYPGVTGISFSPGSHAIAVSGLPTGKTATLTILSWYNGYVSTDGSGGDPQELHYTLVNGLNVVDYDPENSTRTFYGDWVDDYDGLGYITYTDEDDPDSQPDIRIHFINGTINGYLSPDKTNDEMHALLAKATNKHMDVVSTRAHAVWTSSGLYSYCRATDNSSLGYRQYMNILDSLVTWAEQLRGFEKYGLLYKNRAFFYVNYSYYMFSNTRGASFIWSQESRLLNCNTIALNDNDAIWGYSHELGHQLQMKPYFRWVGMTEVTNNMNSYCNLINMGYTQSEKINHWTTARQYFNPSIDLAKGDKSGPRHFAYTNRASMSWCSDFYDLCTEMGDSVIYSITDSVTRAVGVDDVSTNYALCPFLMLYIYFGENGLPDLVPDWYEALRLTDRTDDNGDIIGSDIEKSDGVDKYELIAAAQNKNTSLALTELQQKFPNSVWVTGGYITTSRCTYTYNSIPFVLNFIRKASRLTGYNLFPYFEYWGYLRVVATRIYDYEWGWHILTQAAYDEFKADMQELVDDGTLKEMDDALIQTISYTSAVFKTAPTFPN